MTALKSFFAGIVAYLFRIGGFFKRLFGSVGASASSNSAAAAFATLYVLSSLKRRLCSRTGIVLAIIALAALGLWVAAGVTLVHVILAVLAGCWLVSYVISRIAAYFIVRKIQRAMEKAMADMAGAF